MKDLLFKILPQSALAKTRKLFHSVKNLVYNPLSETDFEHILRNEMKIEAGDVVFVHSSIDKLNLAFPFYKIVNIIESVVGEKGTILFPCWHFNYSAKKYLTEGKVFNVKRSPTVMGLLPELVRRRTDAHRSLHPTNSIVAIGNNAEHFVKDHHLNGLSCGDNTPLARLLEANGKIIGLGERTVSLSFVHCVEDLMGETFPMQTRYGEPIIGKVLDFNRNEIEVKVKPPHENIANRNIPAFVKMYLSKEACREFKYRGNQLFVANSSAFYKESEKLAERGITIYVV